MKIKILFLLELILHSNLGFASSCQGKGSVFFYGNGMFNLQEDANKSKEVLFELIKKKIVFDNKNDVKGALAYKTSEPILFQLFNVVNQKGIDNWENFWLWISSLKKSPVWFQDAMKLKAAEALKNGSVAFDEIRGHFEDYSHYVRGGYNIVLVSHSQGNLYANQVMTKLENYTDASLTGSLADKRAKNLLFPQFFDLFANVQVATPVLATVNSSPWITFKDDLVMMFVRKTVGALPANLQTFGIGAEPDGDSFGHDFIKAYLRNDESKNKILSDIQIQYNKLKYPIAYFQKAVLIESHKYYYGEGNSLHSPDPDLYFDIDGPSGKSIDGKDEERPNQNEIIDQAFAYCYQLPLGTAKIRLSASREPEKEVSFEVWPEGEKSSGKPLVVTLPAKRKFSDWEVGTLHVEKGKGKEPLQVTVEIYPTPKPRSKKEMSP